MPNKIGLALKLAGRAIILIVFGWLLDRFLHTGWLLGVITWIAIDLEIATQIVKHQNRYFKEGSR